MRFRQQQDDARSATLRLLALFALLLALLVVTVNGLFLGLWWLLLADWLPLPPLFIETNIALVLLFVLGGSWVELGRLRSGGGAHVAEWAGGRLLADPRDLLERRLLNVADEMSLASGLPRPAIYVLEREDAINAFAAGWTPADAVVAVTRGALDRLTRDELQGLVAHEFGHIHQDDLRLNMVLLSLVWGLSLVHGYGRSLMEADENGRRSAAGLLVGSVFVAAGSLGWVAGQLLQAAVSRQRELLADACAVQFTRSRDGLGGTLRKVWHQAQHHEGRLRQAHARLLAAMLLQAPPSWLATHPPLPERVRRLYGHAAGPLPAPRRNTEGDAPESARAYSTPATTPTADPAPLAYAAGMASRTPTPSPLPTPNPMPASPDAPAPGVHVPPPRPVASEDEREAMDRLSRINGPGELRAALLALVLTPGSQRERRAWRDETRGLSTADAVRGEVKKLGPSLRLPWFDLLLSRVSRAPVPDRQALVEAARRVMAADGQVRPIDRLQWLAMRHRLGDAQPIKPSPNAASDMKQLSLHALREVARVTAFLARMVPDGGAASGQTWYRAVLDPWLVGPALPEPEPPDADGLVHALYEVQALPWMLKPVLVRAWLEAALQNGPLDNEAADALRLMGQLLDCPMPPELARHYIEPAATP